VCPRPRHPAQHAAPATPPRLRGAVVRARAGGAGHRAGTDLPQTRPHPGSAHAAHEHMTTNATDLHARRNRMRLLAIFAIFLGTMLVAGALRFSGWRPAGMKNHGELLQPPVDLRARVPVLADGSGYRWNPAARTWRIVLAPPAACDQACTTLARD